MYILSFIVIRSAVTMSGDEHITHITIYYFLSVPRERSRGRVLKFNYEHKKVISRTDNLVFNLA